MSRDTATVDSGRAGDGAGALVRLATRLGRETALYSTSSIATFVFAFASVGVLTRYLTLEEFGRLALFNFLAALLTVLYNLGILQGTFIAVFGAGAEEGGEIEHVAARESDPPRALGTGLALTALVGAAGTGIVVLASPLIGTLLLGDSTGTARPLLLAAIAGALGAIWRISVNVLRFERRPWAFTAVSIVRPALVLLFSAGLVAAGYGIDGALAGTATATTLSTAVAFALTWRSYRPALDPRLIRRLWRYGGYTMPFVVAIWICHNVDLYLVSLYVSNGDIARFRVASRIGAGMSYFVSAFLLAWGPLTGTALYAAVQRHRDPGATLITYFLLVALWITLGLSALADGLIRIAPSSYSAAAPLIPLVALGFVAFGLFTLVQRLGRYPSKRRRLVQMASGAAVIFVVSGVALIRWLGVYGAPLAQLLAFGVVTAVALSLDQRGKNPMPLDRGALLRAVSVSAACLMTSEFLAPAVGGFRIVIDFSLLVAFPVLLVATGAVPRAEARRLLAVLRGNSRRRNQPTMVAAVRALPDRRAQALALIARDGRGITAVASALGTTEEVVLLEATRGLRTISGSGGDTDADTEIGAYLFTRRTVSERDRLARGLWAAGADPFEIEAMEHALARLRRLPARAWSRLIAG